MKLGAKIARIRASLGETQEEFAKRFNKATSTIGGWETDQKVPRNKDLLHIAKLGHTTIEELMGVSEDYTLTLNDHSVDPETKQVIADLTKRLLEAEGDEKRILLEVLKGIARSK